MLARLLMNFWLCRAAVICKQPLQWFLARLTADEGCSPVPARPSDFAELSCRPLTAAQRSCLY